MKAFRKISDRHSRRGMVLIEVMIALTVFSVVAFSIVLALDAAFDAAKARNQVDAVVRGLENQRALVHAARIQPADKDMPDDGSGITYHVKIDLEQMFDQKKQPVAGMYRTVITAKWMDGKDADERSVSELEYQP